MNFRGKENGNRTGIFSQDRVMRSYVVVTKNRPIMNYKEES